MKKISFAVLASLFVVASVSAEAQNDGIVTTHDANVAAQIEQHARDAQAQAPAVEHDAPAAHESAPRKGSAHKSAKSTKSTHHHAKHAAEPKQAPAGE